MIHADRHICKESRVVLQSLENTARVILAKTGSYFPQTDYSSVHYRC